MRTFRCLFVVLCVGLTGCAIFNENHYFQSIKEDPLTGESVPTNFYRLEVKGGAFLSGARYSSGYYDERAVDLFFNEVKLKPTDGSDKNAIFRDGQKNPGTQEFITPLSPSEQDGAFVMVLSSNASSVTNAIGQFAQNQVVADAVTNLANKEMIRRARDADPIPIFEKEQAKAYAAQLSELIALVPRDSSPDWDQVERALLRVLNVIDSALGQNGPVSDLDHAGTWLREIKL